MYTAPLSGETRLFGEARRGWSARLGVLGVALGSAAMAAWNGHAGVTLLGLAVFADVARPHRLPGWQARSLPFLAAAAFDAPLAAIVTSAGLAAYRGSGAPDNRGIESAKWGVIEVAALVLGSLAARTLVEERAARAAAAYILVASVLLALMTLWSWVRARTDLFETRACVAEFGRYLPLKVAIAAIAGGAATYAEPVVLLLLLPGALLLAGLHDRDETRRSERAAMLQALGGILRYAHPYTLAHMRRVSMIADRVGAELKMGPRHRAKLAEAALLHDIGKVAVDERILEKPSRLTDDEYIAVQRHSEMGAAIVAASLPKDPIVRWIRSHHERMDGTGYPDRLPSARIPVESRVISVIDAYDAMTGSNDDPLGRRYQPRVAPSQARLELRRHAGTQFDPQVVAAFERVLEEGHA